MLLTRDKRHVNVFSLSTPVNDTLLCSSYFLYEATDGAANLQHIPGKRFGAELPVKNQAHAGQPLRRGGLSWVSAAASKEKSEMVRTWAARAGPEGHTQSPSSHSKRAKLTLSMCQMLRSLMLKNSRLHCFSQRHCLVKLGEGLQVISARRRHGDEARYGILVVGTDCTSFAGLSFQLPLCKSFFLGFLQGLC